MGNGSKTTTPLSFEQFLYIADEFGDAKDFRMEVLCHLMFRCIRISDCLRSIKVCDIFEKNGKLKETFGFYEIKTKRKNNEGVKKANPVKKRFIKIAGDKFISSLKNLWEDDLKKRDYYGNLFYSKKLQKPLNDMGVKFLLKKFLGKRGISQCSPHSFRKGGARFMYLQGTPIEVICSILQHSSVRITFIYIDIIPPDEEQGMKPLEI
ncbi:MAG: site-specific integrase [Chitinivibrionia bacterium]|nr:site-specific integrase [Chitinivibrionia bacterium]